MHVERTQHDSLGTACLIGGGLAVAIWCTLAFSGVIRLGGPDSAGDEPGMPLPPFVVVERGMDHKHDMVRRSRPSAGCDGDGCASSGGSGDKTGR